MMRNYIIANLLITIFSGCQLEEPQKTQFILDFVESTYLELDSNNKTSNQYLIQFDSTQISIRNNTERLISNIDKLKEKLELITQGVSADETPKIITKLMIELGEANEMKVALNNYCKYMSKPGFKVRNIALDAAPIELTNFDKELTPFANYYFENSTLIETQIILSVIKNEILQVENRYYFHLLKTKICT